MREPVPPGVGAEDARHGLLAHQRFQRLQAEGGLVVGVDDVGLGAAVVPGPPRHDVRRSRLAQGGDLGVAAAEPHVGSDGRPGRARPAAEGQRAEVAPAPALRSEGEPRGLLLVVLVEPLVEPGLLELVGADEAVPELMAALVDGHRLRALQHAGSDDGGAPREERGVFHAARGRVPGRVHHGDVRVGVGRRPGAVAPQRDLRGLEVARGQVRVLGLDEQPDVHRRIARLLEPIDALDEPPARHPCEVVDVVLVVVERARAVGVVARALHAAGGAQHVTLGNGEADVVDAVVGEELARGVELMGVPPALPPHADLGEPLGDEVVVVHPARAPDVAVGHLRRPVDLEARRAPGWDGRGRRDLGHDLLPFRDPVTDDRSVRATGARTDGQGSGQGGGVKDPQAASRVPGAR